MHHCSCADMSENPVLCCHPAALPCRYPLKLAGLLDRSESLGLDRASSSHSSHRSVTAFHHCQHMLAVMDMSSMLQPVTTLGRGKPFVLGGQSGNGQMLGGSISHAQSLPFTGASMTLCLQRFSGKHKTQCQGPLCCDLPMCDMAVICASAVTGMSLAQTLAPATQSGTPGLDLAGAAFLVGFAWETVADLQKFHFKSKNPDKCAPDSS